MKRLGLKTGLLVALVWLSLTGCQLLATQDDAATPAAGLTEVNQPAAVATADLVAAPAPDGAAPTVDTAAIAAEVRDQVLAELTPAPTAPEGGGAAAALAAAGLQEALIDVYAQANPAVVYIIVPPVGSGSGFVYNDQGYIVTNNHVVANGQGFEVVFANGERTTAELVGADVDSDLAVLKVDTLPAGVVPLPLGEFDSLRVGEFVVAIGNPFGEQGSMSLGIISALGRSLPSQRDLGGGSAYSLPEVIQTDAPINPGNSGGPLLNLDGEVVGVNAAIATASGTNSGVGFAIPVAAVRRIAPSLIAEGEYVYPYMGAGFDDEVTLDEQAVYGLTQNRGAYVLNVTPGSPAARAGLVAANPNTGRGGDLIVALDGEPVTQFADLNSYLVFQTAVGQTVDVTVLRDGESVVLPLTLGARP